MPAAAPAPAAPASAGRVFDDSFADGTRDDGPDATDSNWWTTSNSSSIEVSTGRLGLVSGGSGRGIRSTFAPQQLSEGQTLKASFTFETPATIGADRGSAFRVALFDTLGRAALEGDLSASSKSPNANFDGLPGYLIAYDVNPADAGSANIEIRRHNDTAIADCSAGSMPGTSSAKAAAPIVSSPTAPMSGRSRSRSWPRGSR